MEFRITPREDLEVFCDFSSCLDGQIISRIIFTRDPSIRQNPWYPLYRDPDFRVDRLGTYKSLLRIRNYRPHKDDGVYQCQAQMLFVPRGYSHCYRGNYYRSIWRPDCRSRQRTKNVHAKVNVYGRPYRQHPYFLYDNIGYSRIILLNNRRKPNNNYLNSQLRDLEKVEFG